MAEIKKENVLVRIYHSTNDKNKELGNDWVYWGIFKTQESKEYVWFKDVSEEEAEQYERDKVILN